MRQSGCWMSILFTNEQMTVFQARSILFQACLELSFWGTRFGPSGSSWGYGIALLICQEHWWRMRWVMERFSSQLQQQCFANWWRRKCIMGLPLSILRGKTLEEWVILACNNFAGIVGEEWQWYLLQRLNSGRYCLLEIQTTPPHRHLSLTPADDPILVVKLPGVAESFNTVIDEMST